MSLDGSCWATEKFPLNPHEKLFMLVLGDALDCDGGYRGDYDYLSLHSSLTIPQLKRVIKSLLFKHIIIFKAMPNPENGEMEEILVVPELCWEY